MLLSLNQSTADSDSFSSVQSRSFRSLQVAATLLSSVKLCKSDFVSHKNKSFIKMLDRIGPSIEPCGIPESIVLKKTRYIVNFYTLFSMLLVIMEKGYCVKI